MTKQEQIAEMAKVIDKAIQIECLLNNNGHCIDCKFLDKNTDESQCQSLLVSTVLYNAGYRKVDEVRKETAKEIFYRVVNICRKEIDFQDGTKNTQLEPLYFGIINGCDFVMYEVKRLAKQYGVEVEE